MNGEAAFDGFASTCDGSGCVGENRRPSVSQQVLLNLSGTQAQWLRERMAASNFTLRFLASYSLPDLPVGDQALAGPARQQAKKHHYRQGGNQYVPYFLFAPTAIPMFKTS